METKQHVSYLDFLTTFSVMGCVSLLALVERTDLEQKRQDFEHLLFEKKRSSTTLSFGHFIEGW